MIGAAKNATWASTLAALASHASGQLIRDGDRGVDGTADGGPGAAEPLAAHAATTSDPATANQLSFMARRHQSGPLAQARCTRAPSRSPDRHNDHRPVVLKRPLNAVQPQTPRNG